MIILDTNVVSEAMKPEPNPAVRAWLNDQAAEKPDGSVSLIHDKWYRAFRDDGQSYPLSVIGKN